MDRRRQTDPQTEIAIVLALALTVCMGWPTDAQWERVRVTIGG